MKCCHFPAGSRKEHSAASWCCNFILQWLPLPAGWMSQITSLLCKCQERESRGGSEKPGQNFPSCQHPWCPTCCTETRLDGISGKFIFWEARAMHRSITHFSSSANTQGSCFHYHLFNPSALRLLKACWLRKYKPRAAFWSLSAAFFCQAEAFLSSDTKCSPSFPPGSCTGFLLQQSSLSQPKRHGSWQDAQVSGRRTTLHSHAAPV